MAYDASNNDSDQTQVAGSAPLSQGDGMAAPIQTPQEGGSTPSATPISTGASVNQAASQGQAQSKASPKASSGMFTNIQKYVQKNKPQAQKMAKAVTQDFSKQAEGIRQAAEQKQAQQQQALSANQIAMQKQQTEAQDLVSQAVAGQPSPEGSATRFQQLMKGPQIQEVGDINLAQQQMKTQALQNLAQGSQREEGTRNLMRETFGDRAYTRGQAGLDELILGGSQAAREGIIEGTQNQAEALQQRLRDIGIQSAQDVGQYRHEAGDFGENIGELITGETGALSQVEQNIQDTLASEKERLGAGQQDFIQALKTGEGLTPEMIQQYIGEDALGGFEKQLKVRDKNIIEKIKKGKHNDPEVIKYISGLTGLDPHQVSNQLRLGGGAGEFTETIKDRDYSQEVLSKMIQDRAKTQDLSSIYTATDPKSLTAQDVISPEQMDRYTALTNLAGIQELKYLPENIKEIDQGTFDLSKLNTLMKQGTEADKLELDEIQEQQRLYR